MYVFLNDWGVGEVVEEDDDLEVKDKYFKYDLDICWDEEDILLIEADKQMISLISLIREIEESR